VLLLIVCIRYPLLFVVVDLLLLFDCCCCLFVVVRCCCAFCLFCCCCCCFVVVDCCCVRGDSGIVVDCSHSLLLPCLRLLLFLLPFVAVTLIIVVV